MEPKFSSCRLAPHNDSGRVRWCVGPQKEWQVKLRKLVFVPIVLLPIVIVVILLTKYTTGTGTGVSASSIPNHEFVSQEIDVNNQPKQLQDELNIKRHKSELRRRYKRNAKHRQFNISDDYKTISKTDRNQVFWKHKLEHLEVRKLQSDVMRQYMDTSVKPCDDFYQYACGKWKNFYTIPPERNSYDTFEILRENLDTVLQELLTETEEELQVKTTHHAFSNGYIVNDNIDDYSNNTISATTKAKHFYRSCLNEDKLTERGSKPLEKLLLELGGWPFIMPDWDETSFDMVWLMAQLRLFNNDILVSEWVGPDLKNSDEYIIHIDQTTLGLPTKDYFTNPSNLKYVEAYKNFIIGVATLLGASKKTVYKDADDLIKFETQIAEIMMSHEDRRHVERMYLRTTIGSLAHYFPQLDWIRYFSMILGKTMTLNDPVACFCTSYLHRLVELLSNTSPRIVANYLLWRFIRHRTNNLDNRFIMAKQRFYYILFGKENPPTRWQFCIQQTNANMGMALGKLFVEKYFDEQSKEDTLEMTMHLQRAFEDILGKTTWIDQSTKDYALMKLQNIDLKIGYPDFITKELDLNKRYSDVEIDPSYFFENTLSILKHLTRYEQKKVGTETNRTLWGTSPAIVNAYYSRNKNQIMFPAGILQPPFYHRHFPKALNFGGIGVVIGHEITHGFDDKGRLFDKHGNLDYWWREPSVLEFHSRAQCMIDQYGAYVLPEVNARVNGFLTQGENIADNGGLKQAFWAYEKWLAKNKDADEKLPGIHLSNQQLFFLNFAQIWCGIQRPETAKVRLQTAVHSPGIFRVLGTLSNSVEFSRVFNCPIDSPMNPKYKCELW